MITRSIGFEKKPEIHARPAAQVAGLASGFESMIVFSFGDQIADAKNVMSVLDFFSGDLKDFELTAIGVDEISAVDQMTELLMTFQ